jgi:hypothetical protein
MVRCIVDGALLSIILLSLILRCPFTLQYVREQVSVAVRDSSLFIRTNYIITAVWAGAMSIIVAAELALHFCEALPVWLGSTAIAIALGGAFAVTVWYPKQLQQQRMG